MELFTPTVRSISLGSQFIESSLQKNEIFIKMAPRIVAPWGYVCFTHKGSNVRNQYKYDNIIV